MKLRWLIGLCLPLLLAGCATMPDWNNRVGHFTYDQAVTDLGPPDKTTTLRDGSADASWLIERGTSAMVGHGMDGAFATPGMAGPQIKQEFPARPDRYLHLSFSPDHVLRLWKEDRRAPNLAY